MPSASVTTPIAVPQDRREPREYPEPLASLAVKEKGVPQASQDWPLHWSIASRKDANSARLDRPDSPAAPDLLDLTAKGVELAILALLANQDRTDSPAQWVRPVKRVQMARWANLELLARPAALE